MAVDTISPLYNMTSFVDIKPENRPIKTDDDSINKNPLASGEEQFK